MIDPDCKVCLGIGWVCESHPNRAWSEEFGCQCGARIPSECAVPPTVLVRGRDAVRACRSDDR